MKTGNVGPFGDVPVNDVVIISVKRNGYVFRRIDARAKVFIEYGSAEKAWISITAPNSYLDYVILFQIYCPYSV